MKILIAGLHGELNGIETYTRYLAQGLSRAGHEVIVIDRSRRGVTCAGARVVRLVPRSRVAGRVRKVIGPFETLRVLGDLFSLAKSVGASVVHCTYPEFAFRAEAPVVVTAFNPGTRVLARTRLARGHYERPWSEALFAASDRLAFKRATAVIAISRSVQQAVAGHGSRSAWVPPFVSDEVIRPPRRRRSRECVMVAGFLDSRRKGLQLAIEAVRRVRSELPDTRLVLVGGWSSREAVDRLPDFCEVRGRMPPEGVMETFSQAGCCLVPSAWEEFGYTGLEALAAGTPLVCGPLPGFEGLPSNGILRVEGRNPDLFAEAIVEAFRVQDFDFPAPCRTSVAIPRIEAIYQEQGSA